MCSRRREWSLTLEILLLPLLFLATSIQGQGTLDSRGTLHISKVQKENSSTYLLRVLKDSGHEEEYKISLMVLDPVPKPVITVKKRQKMNTCYLTLSCGIQDQSVTYTWYWESGSFPEELQSSVLEDVHTPQSYSKSYTCQVSNPISSQRNTIHFTSPCVQASSSGVAWTATWLVIMVTTVLNLLWT
ncbi:hypothetical protein AB1E18_002742 [Capra hircus]